MTVQFTKIEPRSYDTAYGDPRPPGAYEVQVDGVVLGTVRTTSSESWRTAGRIRYSKRGYSRHWIAETPDRQTVTRHAYTRQQAVDALIEAAAQLV